MKRILSFFVLVIVLFFIVGCANNSQTEKNTPAPPQPIDLSPEIITDTGESTSEHGISIIGAPVEDVIAFYEQVGHTVTDGLHGIGANSEDEARKAFTAYLEPFESSVYDESDIWYFSGINEDVNQMLVIFSDNGIITGYYLLPGLCRTVSELIKSTEIEELSKLSVTPVLEKLQGLASDGMEWNNELFGRLVYEENDYIVQIEIVKQSPDASSATELTDALPVATYVATKVQ